MDYKTSIIREQKKHIDKIHYQKVYFRKQNTNKNGILIMLTSSVRNIESRMLPMAVLAPTPTTTAFALPATTTVP